MADTFTRYLKSQGEMRDIFQQLYFNCKELMAQMSPIITNKQEEKFVSSVIPRIMLITNKFKDMSFDLNGISASAHLLSHKINNTKKVTEKVTEKGSEKETETIIEKVSEKGSETITEKSNVTPSTFPRRPQPILTFISRTSFGGTVTGPPMTVPPMIVPPITVPPPTFIRLPPSNPPISNQSGLVVTVPPVPAIPLKVTINSKSPELNRNKRSVSKTITKNVISMSSSTKTTTTNYETPIEYVTHLQMNKLFTGLYVETDISSDDGIIKGYIKEITRKNSTIKIKMLNGKFIIVKYNEQWRIYDPNKMKESNKRSLEFDESTERPKKIRKVRDCSEDDSGIIIAELIDTI